MSKKIYGFVLAIVTSVGLSCSSDDAGDRKKAPKPPNKFSEYAIHVIARTKNGDVRVDFPPVESISAPKSSAAAGSTSKSLAQGPGSKPQVTVEADGGVVSVDIQEGAGFLLLMRAVGQCRMDGVDLTITPPWAPKDGLNNDSWFVFDNKLDDLGQSKFETCESILGHEEILLCAAGLLKEVADAVGPVTWPAANVATVNFSVPGSSTPAYMKDTWFFPPQTQKDKFVVRDLAINVLANLARLDLERPATQPGLDPGETCADGWVNSGLSSAYFSAHASEVFGSIALFDESTPINAGRIRFRSLWPNDEKRGTGIRRARPASEFGLAGGSDRAARKRTSPNRRTRFNRGSSGVG